MEKHQKKYYKENWISTIVLTKLIERGFISTSTGTSFVTTSTSNKWCSRDKKAVVVDIQKAMYNT